ncbi:MAG: hypothetical protein KGV50_00265 [Gammaproteobacteria bacterium]|nr:hypothetical protein [Gammaproteobacteria bacterium]
MLPNKIYNELVEGIKLMDNLNLSFAPSTDDDLQKAVAAWEWTLCAKITWDDEKDSGRLMAAFAEVVPKLEKWPSPSLIIKHLPPRPPAPALPQPETVPCLPHIAAELGSLMAGIIINRDERD